MAEICSACGAKIGMFEKPTALSDDHQDVILCDYCKRALDKAREPASNKFEIEAKEAAIQHFHSMILKRRTRDFAVKSIMEAIGATDDDIAETKRVDEEYYDQRHMHYAHRDDMLLTTIDHPDGYEIIEYKGLVTSDRVIGTGIFSEAKTVVADVAGWSSGNISSKVKEIKDEAIDDAMKQAALSGGNALLGVKVDVYVSAGNMFGVSVTGTAAKVMKTEA